MTVDGRTILGNTYPFISSEFYFSKKGYTFVLHKFLDIYVCDNKALSSIRGGEKLLAKRRVIPDFIVRFFLLLRT